MTGFVVALVGPDGAGKSTLAARLEDDLDMPVRRVYAGDNPDVQPGVLPTTRALWWFRRRRGRGPVHGPPPTETPPRRPVARKLIGAPVLLVLLVLQCAEERARLRPCERLVRDGYVVVLDRSYLHDHHRHDIAAAKRSPAQRMHGWWLERVLPRPDLTVVLDAPAEVLHRRKPEGTLDGLADRRRDYDGLDHLTAAAVHVDADRPLAEVQADVVAAIRSYDRDRGYRSST